MHRYRRVTSQPGALRSVVKQAHWVTARAADTKPLHNWTREPLPAQGGARKGAGDQMRGGFVVDPHNRPLDPVHPGTARWLLTTGQAAVWRREPFTLILKRAVPDAPPTRLRVKIDPGSTTTGIAVVNDATGQVVWAAGLTHRGQQVHAAFRARPASRRSRRQRHTRYRAPRFNNRTRPKGWLPPSVESRVANVTTWVARLRRLCPVGAISQELVKFDTHLMQDAEVSGVAYQQGELAGYEVRE